MTLLQKLESAPEGSRELDAEIWASVCNVSDFIDFDLAKGWSPRFEAMEDGSVNLFAVDHAETWQRQSRKAAPHYTTNLQDAVSLVPEGVEWRVGGNPTAIKYAGEAELADPATGSWQFPIEATGVTPALALCIAIIKAHESKEAEAA